MTVPQSLLVDAFGLAVVFAVLILLSLVIKLITRLVGGLTKSKDNAPVNAGDSSSLPAAAEAQFADGELKLFDVDEKTAALIMAIVSDQSKIPLSQLHFKSIRLIREA